MWNVRGGRRRSVDLVAQARAEAGRRHADEATHPAAPARRSERSGLLFGLIVLGIVGFFVVQGVFGDEGRAWLQENACAVTGCTGPGMATAGWLLIALPLLYVVTVGACWSRLPGRARPVVILVGAPLVMSGLLFVPGRRIDLDELVDGPGQYATATGITWAGAGVGLFVLALLVVPVLAKNRKVSLPTAWTPLVAAGACLAMLGVALARVDPVPVTADLAFPERTFTVEGDTLTRTSAADQRGCAGVLEDDRPLDGCLRTVRGSWTTDDSDAVVRLAAVLFPSRSAARERRGSLPDGTGQAGITGEAIDVVSVSGNWVLFTGVGHADGRAVAGTDRGYLLWAATQVGYRFIGHQVGLLVSPTPKDGIGPRTP
ncbi:hypothetical protein [Micromonospora sp. MW-13]|uniref:hypothetical protein n=1 Tax=Micromonospora sp. MW-13 TaxID=2094022 RepID=UPI000FFEDBA5|nr:hypothetical protein [Micromonospora sp. MW-13]